VQRGSVVCWFFDQGLFWRMEKGLVAPVSTTSFRCTLDTVDESALLAAFIPYIYDVIFSR
jgi:hypothetical protein